MVGGGVYMGVVGSVAGSRDSVPGGAGGKEEPTGSRRSAPPGAALPPGTIVLPAGGTITALPVLVVQHEVTGSYIVTACWVITGTKRVRCK